MLIFSAIILKFTCIKNSLLKSTVDLVLAFYKAIRKNVSYKVKKKFNKILRPCT